MAVRVGKSKARQWSGDCWRVFFEVLLGFMPLIVTEKSNNFRIKLYPENYE